MPFGIGKRNIQNILNAPRDLSNCQKEINNLKKGLEHVRNRERIFLEQKDRIKEHRAIANELLEAISKAEPHCKSYRKYTSPWRLSENQRPFVRFKNERIHITPRMGARLYWLTKIDRVFNTDFTRAPSNNDGGYDKASARISKLNEYTGARINSVCSRNDLSVLKEISSVNIQEQALVSNFASMEKYEKALGEKQSEEQVYQDKVAIKQEMTKAAFELFAKPGAVDYLNNEKTSKKPSLPETLKNISRKDLNQLLNDGFSAQVSEQTGSYRYEELLSPREIAFYQNRVEDKTSAPINKFMPVDPPAPARTDANVVFIITGTPGEAQIGETRYKVFRQGCRYTTTSIEKAEDGRTHIYLEQEKSSALKS
ncbi:hypothetical protein PF66_03606 [Pseudomonas asplenii]|uniref:Uncharacterized protein n=1 Tax=Pseudomonas asplenii TaxID=53407 RepID=A0A0M9GFJ4_9PSED|nr:hypothetical protein [Pseudomonas fuscovaginae]KPA89753.1 hypothetical protein PF66_03606 [Pseudomonas fuscovaginae]